MTYGQTFKDRLISSIQRFFFKIFLFSAILIGAVSYFFMSDFGNSVQILRDFKSNINQKATLVYQGKLNEINNATRDKLGLSPTVSLPVPTPTKTPVVVIPEKPMTEPKDTNQNNNKVGEFDIFKIPFYYDASNVPKNVSKEESLTLIAQASKKWTDACGVSFEYKGDKLADYINGQNTVAGKVGIIKWNTQMSGNAIGEAHVGSERGPASGFVLSLYSDFFANNKQSLINTIVHEMGHVIGLEHSENSNSLMYATEDPSSSLLESDKAMCKYFRYRWSGMNKQDAMNKSGIIFN